MTEEERTRLLKQLKDNLRLATEECDWPGAFRLQQAIDRLSK